MTVGILPRGPVPSEMMTWDLKHMLDVGQFNADLQRLQTVYQEASFNEFKIQVCLNEWKYLNGLMDVCDGANSPTIQEVLRHTQLPGLAIGNGVSTRSQVAREVEVVELCAMNESRQEVRCQTLRA